MKLGVHSANDMYLLLNLWAQQLNGSVTAPPRRGRKQSIFLANTTNFVKAADTKPLWRIMRIASIKPLGVR